MGRDMKMRTLGSTGLRVSEVGLGAWQLGNRAWGMRDDAEALGIVREALERGCNFFDTAPGYAHGRSEELLGEALAPVRDRVVLCTKFGVHDADGNKSFDPAQLRPQLEASLRRLSTDYVDVLLLHNPPAEIMDGNRAPHYELLARLRDEGKLRAYGVSLDSARDLELVARTTGSGAVEVLYNAFHQEPASAFKRAREAGVGLVVKVPLDSGWLAGRYRSNSRFDDLRRRWPEAVIERRGELVEQLARLLPDGLPMALAALRFVLAEDAVSTVIPGAKSIEQLCENLSAADEPLPDETLAALRRLWAARIADDPLPW